MNEHQDFLDEIAFDDPATRRLAASLRAWRDSNRDGVEPDARLAAMFGSEPPAKQPARWRHWMQRPAIAFAASFAAVFLLGAGAFALVANSGDEAEVAAPTTSALSAAEGSSVALGEVTLPEDLSDQTGFASCVFDQLTAWFDAGLGSETAPQLIDECGMPPIPDLGPEAEAFRADLQAWANCAAGEVQAILPQLPSLLKGDNGEIADPLEGCGEPPDPRDYGLELPFLDFGDIDPSQFNFGPFNLEEFEMKFKDFDPESFNLEDLLGKIPPGLLPEDFNIENFDLEELKKLVEENGLTEFHFKGCDPDADGKLKPLDLENFDLEEFKAGLEGCGFTFFGSGELGELDLSMLFSQFGDFDVDGLENLDLESLLGGFNFEDLEGLDLDQLLADLFGDEELDFGSLFEEFSEQNA